MENKKILKVDNYSKATQIISIIGIIVGVATIAFGLFASGYASTYVGFFEDTKYGGDFYTDIYEAVSGIAGAFGGIGYGLSNLIAAVKTLIVFFGIFEVVFFALMLAKNNNEVVITVEDAVVYPNFVQNEAAPVVAGQPMYSSDANTKQMQNLINLYNTGVLTADEFEAEKAKLVEKI